MPKKMNKENILKEAERMLVYYEKMGASLDLIDIEKMDNEIDIALRTMNGDSGDIKITARLGFILLGIYSRYLKDRAIK